MAPVISCSSFSPSEAVLVGQPAVVATLTSLTSIQYIVSNRQAEGAFDTNNDVAFDLPLNERKNRTYRQPGHVRNGELPINYLAGAFYRCVTAGKEPCVDITTRVPRFDVGEVIHG